MITLEEAKKRLDDACAYLHIDEKQALLANLDAQIAQPDFWNDTDHAQCVSKQASDIRDLLVATNRQIIIGRRFHCS